MDFTSTPDCVLFVARAAAAAEYVVTAESSNSALANAQDLKRLCDGVLAEHGISVTLTDDVNNGWIATVFWPDGAMTALGDEPRRWSVQLTEANWERSQLKSDLTLALRHLMRL